MLSFYTKLQAVKSVPLRDALPKLGIAVNAHGFFKIRDEHTASCHILPSGEMWHDFGIRASGDLVQLYRELMKADFVQAVDELYTMLFGSTILPMALDKPGKPGGKQKTPIYIARPLGMPTSRALLDYCAKRCIPSEVVQDYMTALSVSYANPLPGTPNKPFLTLGWQSLNGSWHCRNGMEGHRSKFVCGGQDISVFRHGARYLEIYEGMFSFLSSRSLRQMTRLNGDSLVLNSIHNTNRALDWIRDNASNYEVIYICCDRDRAGVAATERLIEGISKLAVRCVNLNTVIPILRTADPIQDLNDILSLQNTTYRRSCRLCRNYFQCGIQRGQWTFTARKCLNYNQLP